MFQGLCMLDNHRHTTFNPQKLPLFGMMLGLVLWLIDTLIDFFLFAEHQSFFESLFKPGPVELWMRILIFSILVLFSFYAKKLLVTQNKISEELVRYKNHLEETNKSLTHEIENRKAVEKKLKHMATVDALTQIYNRRKFDELLDYEIQKSKRYGGSLSIVFCDIDNFKTINDTYGHDVGDEILKSFSLLLKENLRKSDFLARWGGEEFAILITNTSFDIVKSLVEKIKQEIESYKFDKVGNLTASFGVTNFENNDTNTNIIKRVDKALYRAKDLGRNRIEILL